MQSDTIIGIVGAVVLVAVMVGVFAYEYNNAPDNGGEGPDPDSDAAKMAQFNATYPALAAMEDIDGDMVPNYNDTNIDGDALDNAVDNDTAVHETFSGTVPQQTPAGATVDTSNTFFVGTGHKGGTVTVTWTFTAGPAGAPIDELTVSVTGPGDVTCDNTANGKATCDLAAATPGTYTVEVRHANALAQAKTFEGDHHIQY